MLKTEIDEDPILELQEIEEYPGLISETAENICFLHGFEVDLNGNVIVPTFGEINGSDMKRYPDC